MEMSGWVYNPAALCQERKLVTIEYEAVGAPKCGLKVFEIVFVSLDDAISVNVIHRVLTMVRHG